MPCGALEVVVDGLVLNGLSTADSYVLELGRLPGGLVAAWHLSGQILQVEDGGVLHGVVVAHGRGLQASDAAVVITAGDWVVVEVIISINGQNVGEVPRCSYINGADIDSCCSKVE